jgi:ribosomal protein S6
MKPTLVDYKMNQRNVQNMIETQKENIKANEGKVGLSNRSWGKRGGG